MGLPAGTAGLKRHMSITMEFASESRTISPVPDISRYAELPRLATGYDGPAASTR